MKKILAFLLAATLLLLVFAGCSKTETNEQQTQAVEENGTEQAAEQSEPQAEDEAAITYTYAVKDSEIRITPEADTGRCAADGGYTAHGQYLIKDDYLICYGPCEEDNGVKAIWDYVACDADLEVIGGMASTFKINDDNSLTKVQTYALSLRGSQAIFVYDPALAEQVMMISFYEGSAYHAVGACMLSGNIMYLYGDVTGGDPSWGPMLWPSVKGAYSINVPAEEEESPVNTLNVLSVYDIPANGSALILLNEEATACGFVSISDYGKFFATGACTVADDVLTTDGDCTNSDVGGAEQVWASCSGTYTLDSENMEATAAESASADDKPSEKAELAFASSTDANGYGINLNFYTDGTWKMVKDENEVGYAGKWNVEDGKFMFTYDSDGTTVTEEQAIADGVITIQYGQAHTFTVNASEVSDLNG